jgi:two-component SAPR family response regulator
MKAIIIDDELPSISLMKRMIGKNEYLEVTGEYTNPKEALLGIKESAPDVVFMDIEMPHMTGVELATEIMHFNNYIQIVFVTAYEKYALKAFDVNAVNYILKPITEESINITVTRLLRNYNIINQNFSHKNKLNRIVAFGEFGVYENVTGEKVQWATTKAKELFAYFIIQKGKEVDKWQLCEILYPEASSKNAEHSLHSTISRMKAGLKKVGIDNIITCVKGKYMVDMMHFTCDIWEWKDFLKTNPVVSSENISNYERIMGLYLGELFGTENYIWLITEKERYRREYLNSLKKLASYFINHKNYDKAETFLEEYVKMEAYDEDVAELLIRTYYFTKKRREMISFYCNVERILLEELGIKPRKSLCNLYEELIMKI